MSMDTSADNRSQADEQSPSTSNDAEAIRQDWMMKYMIKALGISGKPPPKSVLDEVTFEGIARYIKSDKCQKIVTMTGAGISTSAGIPDFRSPGTGLYDRLKKYDLPDPQSVFDITYFKQNPEPFFMFRREMFEETYKPTPCHYFIKLLEMKNKLLRHFTQNIDGLEELAGIPKDKMVEAHGSFNTATCPSCSYKYTKRWIKDKIFDEKSESKVPICEQKGCDAVVKPDIVFFGESLPTRFGERLCDIEECDLLLIMGTSLVVQPFASITSRVPETTPRLYINLEKTGDGPSHPLTVLMFGGGFDFDGEDNIRDVFWQGKCDDGCIAMADIMGWGEELRQLVKDGHSEIDKYSDLKSSNKPTAVSKNILDKPTTKPSLTKTKPSSTTRTTQKVKSTPDSKATVSRTSASCEQTKESKLLSSGKVTKTTVRPAKAKK